MSHYALRCLSTGELLQDDLHTDGSFVLANPAAGEPAFLRAEYQETRFSPGPREDGLYRFKQWLPIRRTLTGSDAPLTYHSIALGDELGLQRLYVTFSGYWPERECRMVTATFKECEAYSVCARLPANAGTQLVVASAGNTARAFVRVCSENEIPLVVVIPEKNLGALWTVGQVAPCVSVVAVGNGADYSDAIALAASIAKLPGFIAEGGAKNVARRDGMGTTVLSAVDVIGEIPHHYFQAVGSGTGAIAAWEANLRLIGSGAHGDHRMRLHLSQNSPFCPIHESWRAGQRQLIAIKEDDAKRQIDAIEAKVLANRKPPYSPVGGLYDALRDTDGRTGAVTNELARSAAELFRRSEGIDVAPAAAVAVADLIAASEAGEVDPNDVVMLNVTGGGIERIASDEDVVRVPATVAIDTGECSRKELEKSLEPIRRKD